MSVSVKSARLRIGDVTPSLVAVSEHGVRRVTSVFVLLVLLCWPTQGSFGAENLECPEIGAASVPDLIGDTSGGGLFVSENRIDLANEINEAINRLQIASPNISWTEVRNVLVAAYCRVVARTGGLTASEKWARMRQFDNVLEQQIAANAMPPGTLIIASVPLPPEVFRELRRQAFVSNQTPAQLMTAILSRAAGK
ncbi:hypothetical protein G6321_00039150 [Bradyrhizobium barranii subsp. barranii]|uniref:Uncharacterized protein n=1 Tax=Bradyrhizobium barranii subsp. barranii TaxID=2823807 RepID=A0A7Z0QEL7_9BRAD|nr:hypothetical protein [Bradyrhizobium barranii]UGX91722.1 hypothetical protein G6321_00039150 [Bradyrhizobium barranii subsp. barranii]